MFHLCRYTIISLKLLHNIDNIYVVNTVQGPCGNQQLFCNVVLQTPNSHLNLSMVLLVCQSGCRDGEKH